MPFEPCYGILEARRETVMRVYLIGSYNRPLYNMSEYQSITMAVQLKHP